MAKITINEAMIIFLKQNKNISKSKIPKEFIAWYKKNFTGNLTFSQPKFKETFKKFESNIEEFSVAKAYTVLTTASAAVEANKIDEALNTLNLFNKTYQRTERIFAFRNYQVAEFWSSAKRDTELFPYLEYSATMDANTSEICRALNGIVLPVDDPFWKGHSPLNHYNCRCTLLRIDKYKDAKTTSKNESHSVSKNVNDLKDKAGLQIFKNNSAIDGLAFPPDHPYFINFNK